MNAPHEKKSSLPSPGTNPTRTSRRLPGRSDLRRPHTEPSAVACDPAMSLIGHFGGRGFADSCFPEDSGFSGGCSVHSSLVVGSCSQAPHCAAFRNRPMDLQSLEPGTRSSVQDKRRLHESRQARAQRRSCLFSPIRFSDNVYDQTSS